MVAPRAVVVNGLNTLARIVRAREALEVGDVGLAAAILFDLEEDVASDRALADSASRHERFVHACPHCATSFRWPGELDHHLRFAHFAEAA
jgi:hypothetical protein